MIKPAPSLWGKSDVNNIGVCVRAGGEALNQARIKLCLDELSVKMLTEEYEFLHAVTIYVIPVTKHVGVLLDKLLELVCWHCGIPLTSVAEINLLTCLLEYIADVLLVSEIAHTLCADYALRPATCNKLIEA